MELEGTSAKRQVRVGVRFGEMPLPVTCNRQASSYDYRDVIRMCFWSTRLTAALGQSFVDCEDDGGPFLVLAQSFGILSTSY